jgi:hypothetical protein
MTGKEFLIKNLMTRNLLHKQRDQMRIVKQEDYVMISETEKCYAIN